MSQTDNTLVTRTITVDRTRSAYEALQATRRQVIIGCSQKTLDEMPKCFSTEEKIEVIFFKFKCVGINDDEAEKEYERRDLIPVDPYTLAAVNEAEISFANEYLNNSTHWKDETGQWHSLSFDVDRITDEKGVSITSKYKGEPMYGNRWFAGVRKK